MIAYPVRASGDGTERIIDAAGQVLGTVEIVAALNARTMTGEDVRLFDGALLKSVEVIDEGHLETALPIPQARPHHEAEYVPGRGTWGELT